MVRSSAKTLAITGVNAGNPCLAAIQSCLRELKQVQITPNQDRTLVCSPLPTSAMVDAQAPSREHQKPET